VNVAFSQDCSKIKNDIEIQKNKKIGCYALLGMSIAGAALIMLYLPEGYPPPGGFSESYYKTKKILIGTSLICGITIPLDLILIHKSKKKLKNLNGIWETNCNKFKSN
jgi:hypothetical protein